MEAARQDGDLYRWSASHGLRDTVAPQRQLQRALAEAGHPQSSWQRLAMVWTAVKWEHGRWLLRPMGRWRCDDCGERLGRRLSEHRCVADTRSSSRQR